MAQTSEEIAARLQAATRPGAREHLLRRGLARGMIWRGGVLPEGAPGFAASLTADLLDYGYGVLAQALRLREAAGEADDVETGLRVAAESIESAVRRGTKDYERDFHLVVASCAFHLAHYAARAFSLVPSLASRPNLAVTERTLVRLMRRDLGALREACARWLRDEANQDANVAAIIEAGGAAALDDAERIAITANFIRSIAVFLSALERGDPELAQAATRGFAAGADAAAECRHVPLWWANSLARHLTDDLWENSFHSRVPVVVLGPAGERWARLRRRYIDVLREREAAEIDLWPSQWEGARRCINPTDDLVVALPTSAGKTRIAELCILRALADQRRIVYVTPLRALSAQLERNLGRTFRPLGYSVTALYGASGVAAADVATLRDADIVVATPEKLDFALRTEPSVLDDVGLVVLDEGHMIGLGTREIRYEVLVQRLLRRPDALMRRVVCLSAVFGPSGVDAPHPEGAPTDSPFDDFTAWIRNDDVGSAIRSGWRPTRQRSGVLRWRDGAGRLQVTVDEESPYVPGFVRAEAPRGRRRHAFPKDETEFVLATAKAFLADDQRVLIYCPQRRSVEPLGEAFLNLERQGYTQSLLPPDADITRALRVGREWLGADHVALKALQKGVALHHGTLPRAFLAEIEDLLHQRVLRLVIASPTLAQGLDLSCSVLIFRSVYRRGNEPIPTEEFANVVGRAGRAFVDLDGISVLPVFARDAAAGRRVVAFNRLLQDSASRRLESGLVMLVEHLVELLAHGLGVGREEVRTYVLDVGSAWDVQAFEVDEQGRAGKELVAPALAELDAALLGTVEDLDGDLRTVADALDAALRASLWERRLSRRPEGEASLTRDVIVGRARWLWTRTTAPSRRGYHAAGVGYDAGKFLDDHQGGLVASLRGAEEGLAAGNLDQAAAGVVEIARLLGTVPPFAFENRTAGWEEVLAAWVRGDPIVGPTLTMEPGDSVAFVQHDVVYRLVWGVEAIRFHAAQKDPTMVEGLTGSVASALTYGVPSPAAVVLAQAGLPSREMMKHLLAVFPAAFTTTDGMRLWLGEHREMSESPGFWPDAATAAMWGTFVRRWADARPAEWSDRRAEVAVQWDPGVDPPTPGSPVCLVQDSADGVTYVCDVSLSPLGHLPSPMVGGPRGAVNARVGSGRDELVIDYFGP